MLGITAYASYLPRHRLRGGRIVGSYDEDATTMAVEAARRAVAGAPAPASLYFATTTPPYLEKTNAAAIHAALQLGPDGFAADMAGSPRSSIAALRAAAATGGLALMADLRVGLIGSDDERNGADGAAAFLLGPHPAVEIVSQVSITAELLDRWRLPAEPAGHEWEERFGAEAYVPLIEEAAARVLRAAGLDRADHVVVSCANARAVRAVAKSTAPVGYAGAADPGVRLADALDRAAPSETILLAVAAQGCDATILRVRMAGARRGPSVAEQATAGHEVDDITYLIWRGLLRRQPPRRPEPDRPAAPAAARATAWKFGLAGSACAACGHVHLPPRRACVSCGTVDRMRVHRVADRAGTIATFTVDRLAYSPSPPAIDAVVEFDGGGRCSLQVADATPDEVRIGARVEPTFRRLYTAGAVHDYFWKVRPR